MTEIGKSLPILTGPMSTIDAAKTALNGLGPRFAATMAREDRSINLLLRLCSLEYQGCAKGDIRRHDHPLSMAVDGQPILPMQALRLRQIGNGKAHGVQRHPLTARLERETQKITGRRRSHNLD